jgi:hypothetical protein
LKQQLYTHYDFIIIGDHPSALWGARLLLEKGLKVLVIPMGTDRARNFAPRFALEGLEIDEGSWLKREFDPIQILTPERRFRVFGSADALAEECKFVFGKSIADFSALDRQWVRGMAYLKRGSETDEVNADDWKTICASVNDLIYFHKEKGWLRKQFFSQIEKLGGHVLNRDRLGDQLQRIFVEKKAFVGVQIEGSSSMITADRVLIACNWNLVQTLMSESAETLSQPAGWIFELKLKISEEAIPDGLTSQMLWVQNGAPPIEIDHMGKGEFSLRTVLPYKEFTFDRVEQRKISQRLVKVMEKIVPDLEYNLNRVYPDIRDPERVEQVDLVELYPFHALAQIPSSMLVYSMPGLGHFSGIQGIHFAYEEAYPRQGEWGAYRAVELSIQAWAKGSQRLDLQKLNAAL